MLRLEHISSSSIADADHHGQPLPRAAAGLYTQTSPGDAVAPGVVGAPFWTVSTSSMGTGDREICCALREWNTLLDTSRIVLVHRFHANTAPENGANACG